MPTHSAIVQTLPDIHRWVEARALLLSGACDVFGFREMPELTAVVRDAETGTLFVIGTPDVAAIVAALNKSPRSTEVIASPAYSPMLAIALPGWSRMTITVHRLRSPERLPEVPAGAVRFLDPAELPRLPIEAELKQDLEDGAKNAVIAATFVAGEPVAFCAAGAVTESFWDIGVDTIEAHRRKGYAGLCITFMVHHMRMLGKEPVWQSADDNPPSSRLAAKLGFEPIDKLVWFRRSSTC